MPTRYSWIPKPRLRLNLWVVLHLKDWGRFVVFMNIIWQVEYSTVDNSIICYVFISFAQVFHANSPPENKCAFNFTIKTCLKLIRCSLNGAIDIPKLGCRNEWFYCNETLLLKKYHYFQSLVQDLSFLSFFYSASVENLVY